VDTASGRLIIWWPKKTPTIFNRALNQVWNLEYNKISKSYYIKDEANNFYLCYRDNKTMFLSNKRSDKKIIFKYDK
jgi:hypothetical protein